VSGSAPWTINLIHVLSGKGMGKTVESTDKVECSPYWGRSPLC